MTSTPARSFDTGVERYAAGRPSYPSDVLDLVEHLAGQPFAGARVADIGAGTGTATILLRDRGAEVVAVEFGSGMACAFHRRNPGMPVVRGDGNRLPLASASFDFITYAQSWNWTDPAASLPEALRVLRPGGALAIWRNDLDESVPWIADQRERLRQFFSQQASSDQSGTLDRRRESWTTVQRSRLRRLLSRRSRRSAGEQQLPAVSGTRFNDQHLTWSREVTLKTHLDNLASHSDFLRLGQEATQKYLAREQGELVALRSDGMVEERYVTSVSVARR
ncbi:class I SAM-dependent methyltransferase [Streptomyces anulatus]|uniref:class I SAM-dependent methyltransferase n=1 Tax=Streptomyces anulatus TaxID=1892 RepID=UPI002E824267|nr:class I SAM-dependent methyltransferase [Streptomyces anulatus]WUC91869.1 class I SAM-dependent methyltransferase [Streptomyces anulatus]